MFDKLSAEQRKVLLFALGGVVLLLIGFAFLHRKALTAGTPTTDTSGTTTGAPNYTRGGDVYVSPGATFAPGATLDTSGTPTSGTPTSGTPTSGTPTSGTPVTPGSPVVAQLPVTPAASAAPIVALATLDNTVVAPIPVNHPAIVTAASAQAIPSRITPRAASDTVGPLHPAPATNVIAQAVQTAAKTLQVARAAFGTFTPPRATAIPSRPQFDVTAQARANHQLREGF